LGEKIKMVVDSSVPIDYEIIQAGQAPVVMISLLTGSKFEGGRSAGIFTADDLIKILLYVRAARKLPQRIEDISSNSTGITGLEPGDIIDLSKKITDHAHRWTPVENLVRDQASKLKYASDEIVNVGKDVTDTINSMDNDMIQALTVDDPNVKIPISNKDNAIQKTLLEIMADLKELCLDRQQETRRVLTAVRDYKTELSGGTLSDNTTVMGLEPLLSRKKELAKKAMSDTEIIKLQGDIDILEKEINQLRKDYDKYVGLAFTGILGGIIGIAITGGIFGAKAEAARKTKNSKIAELEKISKDIKRKQEVQGILNEFATQFTDIEMRLLDAEQSLSHLDSMWSDMVANIDGSLTKLGKVKDSDTLSKFLRDFKNIVRPWEIVGDMSAKLSNVFDQAIEEFRKTYTSQ
jgi:hypothetical protein